MRGTWYFVQIPRLVLDDLCSKCLFFLLHLKDLVSHFEHLIYFLIDNKLIVSIEWNFRHIDRLRRFFMQERHKDADKDHVLELPVEGQLNNLVEIIATGVEDLSFVLTDQEWESNSWATVVVTTFDKVRFEHNLNLLQLRQLLLMEVLKFLLSARELFSNWKHQVDCQDVVW